jgi:hypothetical protein
MILLTQGFTGVFRKAGETFVHIQLTRVDKKSIYLTAKFSLLDWVYNLKLVRSGLSNQDFVDDWTVTWSPELLTE